MTETSIVYSELKMAIKNIEKWNKPKKVLPSMLNFPSSAKIYSEPYETVLIIAPWNYPFQLAISRLIGAIAAGNTIVLKPSELTPHTSTIVREIIEAVFYRIGCQVMVTFGYGPQDLHVDKIVKLKDRTIQANKWIGDNGLRIEIIIEKVIFTQEIILCRQPAGGG